MKRFLVAFFAVIVLSCIGISLASAKTSSVTASLPHTSDSCNPAATTCPATATPQPGGNTTSGQHGHSGDEDGDGIPDGIDQCPNEGGPSSNQGCPAGRSFSAASNTSPGLVTPSIVILPILPTSNKVCALATRTDQPVNVRSLPSIHAPVIAQLDPQILYSPDSSLLLIDGSLWYALNVPYGWVAASAVRVSAGCPYVLPAYKQHPPTVFLKPLPVSSVTGLTITLDKGSDPGSDTPRGYCSPSFGINFTTSDGVNKTIHFTFGDGSVQPNPAQGCIKLDPDGHGFSLFSPDPCDITQANPTCVVMHGALSYVDNMLTLTTFIQPTTSPGEPPPDLDKPSVVLTWGLEPPDPCKTGDQSCPGQTGALNFVVDWSQNAAKPGLAFSWNDAPLDPCKPGDQSCTEGLGTQGALLNFLPAVQNNGDSSARNVVAYWFPNGFDPNIGGFTLIENQPGGSNPDDIYGFTLIENQPLSGETDIHFDVPVIP